MITYNIKEEVINNNIMASKDSDGFILVPKRKPKNTKSVKIEQPEIPNYPNQKKVLCTKMIKNGQCQYGMKCTFAHSLEEQNVEPLRKKAYTIIKGSALLDDIDLYHDRELFNILRRLTRTCFRCVNKQCTGGYNCNNGAIDEKHTICFDDLMRGKCNRMITKCNKVHLTERNLIPYHSQLLIYNSDLSANTEYKKIMTNNIPKVMDIHDIIKPCKQPDNDSIDSLSDDTKSVDSCQEYILTLKP